MIDMQVGQPEQIMLDSGIMVEVGGGAADGVTQKTVKEWEADAGTVSEKDHIYVITDYETDENGTVHPAIKIGDGKAYIGDLPVLAGAQAAKKLSQHIADTASHVSETDRDRWNSAVKAKADADKETLYLRSVTETETGTETEKTGE